jgi:acyl dehydratase
MDLSSVPAFALGARWQTMRRTLSDGEFTAIVNATWENGPIHTDDVYAASTSFGRRILGGPCLVAVLAGLSTPSMWKAWSDAGLDFLGALGIDEVRYDAPVFIDDTLHVDIEVVMFEPTPGGSAFRGVVQDVMRNQRGESVLRMRRTYLLKPLVSGAEPSSG